jgi:hypothetical protein
MSAGKDQRYFYPFFSDKIRRKKDLLGSRVGAPEWHAGGAEMFVWDVHNRLPTPARLFIKWRINGATYAGVTGILIAVTGGEHPTA